MLDAIKAAFKSKPITIIVEEGICDFELTTDIKTVLDERLQEDESTYLTAEEDNIWKRGVVFVKEIVPRAAISFIANSMRLRKIIWSRI